MHWYPNRDAVRILLDDIWPRLNADGRERRLTVVGQNPIPPLLRAARGGRVAAPGFVDDVRPYLDRATVFVCPIRDGGGTRLKVLDALAMSRPLVATGLTVEGLGLEDGRHYLRAETADQFVAAIRRVERDEDLRRRLATEGRRLVESRFAWGIAGERLRAAYVAAVRPGGSPESSGG
jgi:glycosyltransferase involved in cell wall biosynthesis